MTAKKTAAAPKKTASKTTKPMKSSARKSLNAKPAAKAQKPAARPEKAKAASAAKPAAKSAPLKKTAPAKVKVVKAPAPATAVKAPQADAAPKKPAAAAARSKPSASTAFDPDRRLELIAAAARRRKSEKPKAAPAPVIPTPARPPEQTEPHRFSIGDEVRVVSTSGMWFKHGIEYRVTAALPPQGGKLQYRIKNEQEPFERVVSESQLAIVQTLDNHA